MKDQDLPESEDIEDRRDDAPTEAPGPWKKLGYALSDTAHAIANSSTNEEEHHGDLADEAGYNNLPERSGKFRQVAGLWKGAAGGPVPSTLKRLDKHPIFPNVKIVHGRIPGLVNSSVDMTTITVNSDVPTTINVNGKRVPTAAPLAVRELYTRAGCEVFREAAQKHGHVADERDIHACGDEHAGQVAEKQFLREHYKFDDNDLAAYAQIMQRLVPGMRRGGPVERQTYKDAAVMGGREEERRPTRKEIEENNAAQLNSDTPDNVVREDQGDDFKVNRDPEYQRTSNG